MSGEEINVNLNADDILSGLLGKGSEGINLELSSYREIKYLCDVLDVSRLSAFRLLDSLHVPLFFLGKKAYYNPLAFETILFVLTRFGAEGFASPGCDVKSRGRLKCSSKNLHPLTRIPDAILEQAKSPLTLLEMIAAQTHDKSLAKALLQHASKNEGK